MKRESLYDYVMRQLDLHKGKLREIADEMDMSYSSLMKIYQRVYVNPGVHSVQKIADYFRRKRRKK